MSVPQNPRRLDAVVRELHAESWGTVRRWIETGKVSVDGRTVTDPGHPTGSAARIELRMNAPRTRDGGSRGAARGDAAGAVAPEIRRSDLVHVDTQLVVVDKPAGVSTVPFEKNERDSLEQGVARLLGQSRLVVVQRLDRETSGLIVFARNHEAGRALAQQFRFRSVRRRYLAVVHGEAPSGTIRSELVGDRGDGLRGSRPVGSTISRDEAQLAVTHVTALASAAGMTLVECRLETGRTHQIRIHLSEAGHPLLGERAYIREFRGERLPAARLMLHAFELGFEHPTRHAPVHWLRPPPVEFLASLPASLRERALRAANASAARG